ncbi:response regulator [Rhodoferax mekongensis]|uniref:Response regulator n=1 Tax=Rhodoferax mekongensis TaxID=3068341 RepID=A0ABZ0B635_9BURK|nr:response regulator [Rhodoferax sp. TBRC 17307]WNO06332.1 response regulator [Rhodoferax sp. TBRC 17307]
MSAQAPHILVVDDNPINRMMAARLLKEAGYTGMLVDDGLKALAALQAHQFDGVLLDESMPNLDGTGVLKEVAKWRATGKLVPPIMMVTGNDLPSDVARFRELGAKGLIPKPLTRENLQRGLSLIRQIP